MSGSMNISGKTLLDLQSSKVSAFFLAIGKLPMPTTIGSFANNRNFRQFCMELNGLAVKLQAECKPETCTQVKKNTGSGMYHCNTGMPVN